MVTGATVHHALPTVLPTVLPTILPTILSATLPALLTASAAPPTRLAAAISLRALPSEVSVTKLAALIQCPYRFALQAAFKVQPLSEPAQWPAHLERGNLLHEALHGVAADLRVLQEPKQLKAAISAAIAQLSSKKLPLSGRYAALAADSQRTVSTYVSAHIQRQQEGWRVHAAEHALETSTLLAGVRVHGKVDRLDAIFDAAGELQAYAVLDYKTSSEALLKAKRDDGLLDAQLALYAAVLEQLDWPTAQAAYWRLHDGLYDSNASKSDYHSKKTVLELADLPLQVDAVHAAVRRAWGAISQGGAAHATPSAHACLHCPYTAVCRSSDLAALNEDTSDE